MTYRLSDVYTAIADPHRREIMDLLMHAELNVAEIASNFDISRTAVDKHINVLVGAQLVKTRKQGRSRLHRLNPDPMRQIWNWVEPFNEFWSNSLQQLKENVEQENVEQENVEQENTERETAGNSKQ